MDGMDGDVSSRDHARFLVHKLISSLPFHFFRGHAVICVAEGAGQDLLAAAGKVAAGTDASGNPILADVGKYLKGELKRLCSAGGEPVDVKYIDPSYLVRSVPTIASDRVYAKVKRKSVFFFCWAREVVCPLSFLLLSFFRSACVCVCVCCALCVRECGRQRERDSDAGKAGPNTHPKLSPPLPLSSFIRSWPTTPSTPPSRATRASPRAWCPTTTSCCQSRSWWRRPSRCR